jgi:hypothetical protein
MPTSYSVMIVKISAIVTSLCFLAIGLFSAIPANAVGIRQESAHGSMSQYVTLDGTHTQGQVYTSGYTALLDRFQVALLKTGTPGAITVDVYATSNGVPTGPSLSTGTILESAVSSSTPGLVPVDFSSPASLTSGSDYAVVFSVTSSGAGNFYNVYTVGINPGRWQRVTSTTPGTWVATPECLDFETYLTFVSPSSQPSSSSSSTSVITDPSLVHTGINEVQSYQYLGLGAVLLLVGAVVINIARVRSRQD